MRASKFINTLLLIVSLLAVVCGVSTFFGMMVSIVFGILLRTDSNWVFMWIGFPLSGIFAVYWIVTRWDYVKSFISGRGGW